MASLSSRPLWVGRGQEELALSGEVGAMVYLVDPFHWKIKHPGKLRPHAEETIILHSIFRAPRF